LSLAASYHKQGKDEDAIQCYRAVLNSRPDHAEANFQLGCLLLDRWQLADAIAYFQQSLCSGSHHDLAAIYCNLGEAYRRLNYFEDAAQYLRQSVAIQPKSVQALTSLGLTLLVLGEVAEARNVMQKAISLQTDLPHWQFYQGLFFLAIGDYQHGLPLYEQRPGMTQHIPFPYFATKPRWQGENLQDKNILVWSEQGAGDHIMMMRYIPLLKLRSPKSITIFCEPELMRVMHTVADNVVSRLEPLSIDCFDCHCSIMSLPYLFSSTLATIPNDVPYLSVPSRLSDQWGRWLSGVPGLKVGIAWAGNKILKKDFLRSMPLKTLAPLFDVAGVRFFCLQKGAPAEEMAQENWPIVDCMGQCHDFMETAALMQHLDLVICVDTSIAHLAGAIGKPVWLLNRFESEWRWMMHGADSIWYPNLRIFRQTAVRNWGDVVQKVASELAALVHASSHVKHVSHINEKIADAFMQHNAKKNAPSNDSRLKESFFSRWIGKR